MLWLVFPQSVWSGSQALRSISIITPLLSLNTARFVFFPELGKLEKKTTLAAVARQRFVKPFGKGNVKIQLALWLFCVFKFIKEINSAFAEGSSTCNISLLIVIDKGLFLENAFLKLSYSVPGPGLGTEVVMTSRRRRPSWPGWGDCGNSPLRRECQRPGQGWVHRPGSRPS